MATADRPNRFLLDVMCGRLAVYLRLCGYDVVYVGDCGVEADDRLLEIAESTNRTLVTRDVSLSRRADDALLLTEHDPTAQLRELREHGIRLAPADRPTRCGRCNGVLEPVSHDDDRPAYAPSPDEFDCWRCVECEQYFWKGSHWDRMKSTLQNL